VGGIAFSMVASVPNMGWFGAYCLARHLGSLWGGKEDSKYRASVCVCMYVYHWREKGMGRRD